MQNNAFQKKMSRQCIGILLLLLHAMIISFSLSVYAQDDPRDTAFNIHQFKPSPGPLNFFQIESPELGDNMTPSVGGMLWYGRNPLTIFNCKGDDCSDSQTRTSLDGNTYGSLKAVENLMTLNLMASFNLVKRLQIGLAVPITVWQTGQGFQIIYDNTTEASGMRPGNEYSTIFSPSDIRVHLKVRILGDEQKDGLFLGASAYIGIPLWNLIGYGKEDNADGAFGYGGDTFISGTAPRLLLGFRHKAFRTAVNAGMHWRKKVEFLNLELGHQIEFGAAVGYSVIPQVELIAELVGNKSIVSSNFTDTESVSLIAQAGGRFPIGNATLYLAGGGGILSGVGVPQFQLLAGAAWTPSKKKDKKEEHLNPHDFDMDGIANEFDKCPNEAEDVDGFEDEDGCPDPDNDGDKIFDGYDSCPNDPEDLDGFMDDDGCPDLDHDEDGILEPNDKCPEEPEDFDGFEDEDGCPEPDNDRDGILDVDDFCPEEPEDIDGFEDEDGCPEYDNDGDGVPDMKDLCPNEPEVLNGIKDDDGCPDKGKPLVVVSKNKIELKEMIQFKTNSDEIKGAVSFDILNIVSSVLLGNPELKVMIEGHTDNKGSEENNRKLSQKRADSVKKYLVSSGIAAARLETKGYGSDKPIEDNKTVAGRNANRRVEFIIIRAPEEEEREAAAATAAATAASKKEPQSDKAEEKPGASMDMTDGSSASDDGGAMDFTQ